MNSLTSLTGTAATCALALFFGACGDDLDGPLGPMSSASDGVVDGNGNPQPGTPGQQPGEGSPQNGPENPYDPDDADGSGEPLEPGCVAPDVTSPLMQNTLSTCRNCHRANSLASGARYLLTTDPRQDAAQLRKAFLALGDDLLAVPAMENGHKHDGGRQLVPGSDKYNAWKAMLDTLGHPDACP